MSDKGTDTSDGASEDDDDDETDGEARESSDSPLNSAQHRSGTPASHNRCHVIAPATTDRCRKARMVGALVCETHRRRLMDGRPLSVADCSCHERLEPGADRCLLITLAPNHVDTATVLPDPEDEDTDDTDDTHDTHDT